MSKNERLAYEAHEVLAKTGHGMPLARLVACLRGLCDSPEDLRRAMVANRRRFGFTKKGLTYSLAEFRWGRVGNFSYLDPALFA